jgi:DNA-binding CsgD family transcriptional regulator
MGQVPYFGGIPGVTAPRGAGQNGGTDLAQSLLEREVALSQLGALAREVRRGCGRVALLRGEAGVGKTAVIARFTAGLSSARVLHGWCDPLTAPRPLGPLVDALSALNVEAARGLDAAIESGDTAALYRRLLAMLRDGQHWVWVIEDAHWADGATLDLMRFLARRIAALPLLLVVSYREEEVAGAHPLAIALGDVARCAAVHRLELKPLSREAVTVLAAGSGVNAHELHELTGGNPFFVTEVLANGVDASGSNALPRSVSEAVAGRLAQLSAQARETVQAAAVCGPRAGEALVAQVCPAASVGLDECLDAGVLIADGGAIGFRHELARRATLEQIGDHQRRNLHARALAALAVSPVDPNAWAALAFHAEEAGDQAAAVRCGIAAAQRAAELGAHRQAAELYALALRHADTAPSEQKVIWLEQHAYATFLGGGLAEAAATSWRDAITLRHKLGDSLGESANLRWLSQELWALGRVSEAADLGLASLRLVQDGGPCPQLAWSLLNIAELGVWGFDPNVADYADRAIAVGTQLGDDGVVVRARGLAAFARVLRTDDGWEVLEAAWRDAVATDVVGATAAMLGAVRCYAAALHYDPDRADRYVAETVAFCRDHDIYSFGGIAAGVEALVALHRGQWERARACAEGVLTRPGLPVHQIVPRLTLALIHARRGEQPVAALLDEIESSCEIDQLRLLPVRAARAEAGWLAGDDDTARREAQSGLATGGGDGDPWLMWQLRRWVHIAGGSLAPLADQGPVTPFQLEVSGDWQAAAAEWTRRGCAYEAAIAQLGGDVAAAEAALATFRQLGARAATRRAQQRLAGLRGPTRRSRLADLLADPDGLSRREREVLTLVAAGHNNADIAAKLSISRKTAGHHVSSILAKLGVDNRIQAAAHALQSQTASERWRQVDQEVAAGRRESIELVAEDLGDVVIAEQGRANTAGPI